jgi:hypothetical protein
MSPKEAPKGDLFQMQFGGKQFAKVVQKTMSFVMRAILSP